MQTLSDLAFEFAPRPLARNIANELIFKHSLEPLQHVDSLAISSQPLAVGGCHQIDSSAGPLIGHFMVSNAAAVFAA